jgi:hypothetical protein
MERTETSAAQLEVGLHCRRDISGQFIRVRLRSFANAALVLAIISLITFAITREAQAYDRSTPRISSLMFWGLASMAAFGTPF